VVDSTYLSLTVDLSEEGLDDH